MRRSPVRSELPRAPHGRGCHGPARRCARSLASSTSTSGLSRSTTMPDEIDLLRRFRGDTPEPDDAAWNRARTALADARSVKRRGRGTPGRRHWSRWRPPGRRVTITALAGIVAVAAAVLVAVVTQGPPTLTGALTTSWQPARLLPGSAHPASA